MFTVGDTVRDVDGETWLITGPGPFPGLYIVDSWFAPDCAAIAEAKLYPHRCPPQPSDSFINILTRCTHPRRSFIGISSGRWACAECGEYL